MGSGPSGGRSLRSDAAAAGRPAGASGVEVTSRSRCCSPRPRDRLPSSTGISGVRLLLLLLLLSSTLSQVLKSLSKKNLINQTYRYITRYRYGTLPMLILRPPVVNKLSMVQNRPIYGWVWFWTKHFYTSCYTQIHKQRGYRNV